MKHRSLIVLLIVLILGTSCGAKNDEKIAAEKENKKTEKQAENSADNTNSSNKEVKKSGGVSYSNLVDEQTVNQVKSSLLDAGLAQQNIDNVLNAVKDYNDTIKNVSLVEAGFVKLPKDNPQYDIEQIDRSWTAKYPEFVGYNCRLTAYMLMHDAIQVKTINNEVNPLFVFDNDAITYSKNPFFTKEHSEKYNTIFGGAVPTEMVKDIAVHLKNVKAYWMKHGVEFKNKKASLITVWIHSDLDNVLFVGHTGVLVKNKNNKYYFVEKLTFQDPYQVVEFANKKQFNDYLMKKYDIDENQPTAKPFIMENGELLSEYNVTKATNN